MFKIIIPKAAFKELEKIDSQNQKLIFTKIKDLETGIFDPYFAFNMGVEIVYVHDTSSI